MTTTAAAWRIAPDFCGRYWPPSALRPAPVSPWACASRPDDQIEGGVEPEEAASIAKLVEPDIDFLDVSLSSYWRFHRLLSTLDEGLGYEVPTSEVVTTAVDVPTIVTGRITTLDHAEHLIKSGVADLVSIVRGMIADPDLVSKAPRRQGKRDPPLHRHLGGVRGPVHGGGKNALCGERRRRPGSLGAV